MFVCVRKTETMSEIERGRGRACAWVGQYEPESMRGAPGEVHGPGYPASLRPDI